MQFKDCPTIETIIFDANALANGATAGYFPNTKTIIIDLLNCVNNRMFSLMGMMYLPNIWFNMLWALYHEQGHALQLERDPGTIKYDVLPSSYEDEADNFAKEMLYEWAEHNSVPQLAEMGWAKTSIENMINANYAIPNGDKLLLELHAFENGGVAEIETFAIINKEIYNLETMKDQVDQGKMGIKINNDRFLTGKEFIGGMFPGTIMNTHEGSKPV
jgi:hypothetical protein